MGELADAIVEILSAGEMQSFSDYAEEVKTFSGDSEEALEYVAGGKMDLRKGTAAFLASLGAIGPFSQVDSARVNHNHT